MNELPLNVALDVLYARANGGDVVFGIFEMALVNESIDPARRSLLLALSDTRGMHERLCGWTVRKWHDEDSFVVRVKLTPPKEQHEPTADRHTA